MRMKEILSSNESTIHNLDFYCMEMFDWTKINGQKLDFFCFLLTISCRLFSLTNIVVQKKWRLIRCMQHLNNNEHLTIIDMFSLNQNRNNCNEIGYWKWKLSTPNLKIGWNSRYAIMYKIFSCKKKQFTKQHQYEKIFVFFFDSFCD